MPLGGPYLTNGELNFIEDWIWAGAPNSGIVADPLILNDVSEYIVKKEPIYLYESKQLFEKNQYALNLRKKNNWDQGLAVIIAKQDVSNWLESY